MVGQRVPLTAVYALAQKITSKYGNDGYVLSRAIVPPQQLSPDGAIVHIDVVEGYIDKVEWPRQLARYRDFFTAYAAKITAQRPVNIRTIERYLLLAGDLPGLKFKTSLRPSETARRRRNAGGRGRRKAHRRQRPYRQPRHAGARAVRILRIGDAQQSVRAARGAGRSPMRASFR